jgi:hypothetical protein
VNERSELSFFERAKLNGSFVNLKTADSGVKLSGSVALPRVKPTEPRRETRSGSRRGEAVTAAQLNGTGVAERLFYANSTNDYLNLVRVFYVNSGSTLWQVHRYFDYRRRNESGETENGGEAPSRAA